MRKQVRHVVDFECFFEGVDWWVALSNQCPLSGVGEASLRLKSLGNTSEMRKICHKIWSEVTENENSAVILKNCSLCESQTKEEGRTRKRRRRGGKRFRCHAHPTKKVRKINFKIRDSIIRNYLLCRIHHACRKKRKKQRDTARPRSNVIYTCVAS